MKKKNLVLGFMLIMLLALSTSVMATDATPPPLQAPGSPYNASTNPYVVSTLGHLSWLAQNTSGWNVAYKQTANIDATETQYWDDVDDGSDGDKYNDPNDLTSTGNNEGFSPIGNNTHYFTGSYDGQGHTIDSLFINRSSTDYIGFFGWASGATIINLGVTDVNITGRTYVGGLVGYNNSSSTVSNSYSTGSVSGSTKVGGLVGYNSSSTVSSSFWNITTSGQALSAGGTGKTIAEMKNLATFTDETTVGLATAWDFETNPNDDDANNNYWDIDGTSTINNGYPYLSWEDGEDVSLPVELTSFTATAGDGKVTLKWVTESEIENLGFNMYRSLNSNRQYTIINNQLIQGAGNSSSRHEYEYVDRDVTNGIKYWYKLEDVDYSGNTELHGPISATPVKRAAPKEFRLYPNYPNPFNPITTISYDLPKDGYVELVVYNMRGEKVATLMQGNQEAGSYRLNWDGTSQSGDMVASGIYFLRIASGNYCRTDKMIFIR